MPEPTTERPIAGLPGGTFDDQAPHYDGRAGLPSEVGDSVARSIIQQANVGTGDLVVELGAGTGEIGVHLARLPIKYVGLDSSAPMLQQFREKAAEARLSLILADCNLAWPLDDGVATSSSPHAPSTSSILNMLQVRPCESVSATVT